MSVSRSFRLVVLLLVVLSFTTPGQAGPNGASAKKKPMPPKIADDPKTVDPATLMPAKLAKQATADFSNSSLREILEWLRTEHQIVALLDKAALDELGILPSEPVSDRLDNAPIYLLLNRLRALRLAWYFEDDVLYITSEDAAKKHLTTLPHNIGDLLDAGYMASGLVQVMESAVEPDSWAGAGVGEGNLSSLGDVLFVRQTHDIQDKVRGLLEALRKHGRQTFVCDPSQHLALREKLEKNVSVSLDDVPLEAAMNAVAKKAGVDIRLDTRALNDLGISRRTPVTLKLSDRKLQTVLRALTADLKLTCVMRDGVLCITSRDAAEGFLKTAVYDVRDLCRDDGESDALIQALMSGTGPDRWKSSGTGEGEMVSTKPGTLIVLGQEDLQMRVLDLLETYRTALRQSRPRKESVVDPNEVITVYYRMHANVAHDLNTLLPQMVRPASWVRTRNEGTIGEITLVSSPPEYRTVAVVEEASGKGAKTTGSTMTIAVPQSVLIIKHTRETHEEIAEVLRRVESGDAAGGAQFPGAMGGMGGMGMGGNGNFGAGYFSVPGNSMKRPNRK
ncbi:MAG: hypothetical protein JW818_00525 [Pirellulales bacterium]|nr:hypothetical protein [Pirellulales bacterium]